MKRALIAVAVLWSLVGVVLLLDRPERGRRAPGAGPGNGGKPGTECQWLAADLDVKTSYSLPSQAGSIATRPVGLSIEEQATAAAARDLDVLAVADVRDLRATEATAFGSGDIVWIAGYEESFRAGAQLLGVNVIQDVVGTNAAVVDRVTSQVQDEGGVLQISHPGDGAWDRAYGLRIVPTAVEVWVAGSWSYSPNWLHKDGARAVGFYDQLLDGGEHVAITGGSRNPYRVVSEIAGVGQPTTWLCARERTQIGVLDAIREGRSVVVGDYPSLTSPVTIPRPETSQPLPDTSLPFVLLESDPDGDGVFDKLVGDTIPPGAEVRAVTTGAIGTWLRIIGRGSKLLRQVEVRAPAYLADFVAPKGGSIRAELYTIPPGLSDTCRPDRARTGSRAGYCGNGIEVLAMTSPIYVDD